VTSVVACEFSSVGIPRSTKRLRWDCSSSDPSGPWIDPWPAGRPIAPGPYVRRATSRGFLFTLILLLPFRVQGHERAIGSLARILTEFVHICAPAQCETLRSIVAQDTTSASERTLALAMLRVNHVPDPADMARLYSLAKDPDQTSSVRTVARALYQLVHAPSDQDREALSTIVAGAPQFGSAGVRLPTLVVLPTRPVLTVSNPAGASHRPPPTSITGTVKLNARL
jgi:hypothetical protein